MQIELTLPVIGSVVAIVLSISSFLIARGKASKELERRITTLETKIEPFWQFINKELPTIIMQDTTPALDELMAKSKNGDELDPNEYNSLLSLLEEEYSKAKGVEDTGRAFAIALYRETIKYKQNNRGKINDHT